MARKGSSPQRENFPRLDLVAAKAAMENMDSAAVCVFTRRRQMIGQLFLSEVFEKSIIVEYIFAEENLDSKEDEVLLRTVEQPNPLDKWRRVFECPGCTRKCWTLYYRSDWACADCHGLLYRSQLIDKDAKLWEKRDKLHSALRHGRPKGMHNRTYVQQRLELARLEGLLRNRPRKYASEEQEAVITEKWVLGSEIEFWSSKYTIERGSFVRRDY